MKDSFIGYYTPTDEEIDKTWNEGVFSFDANALLNLYRYSESTRGDFFKVLKKVNPRLWISFQSAYEFHNNRLTVIDSIRNSYDVISETLDKSYENFEKGLNSFREHPIINIDDLKKKVKENHDSIKQELKDLQTKHPDYYKDDPILNELTSIILEKYLGEETSDKDLIKIYEEGKERFDKKIPPGYQDLINKKEKGQRHIYGDLIIWKELIKEIKKTKKQIIFVTDDRKEDWWSKHNGKTIRPREELIKEFYKETGIRILIYQADVFIKYAKQRLIDEIKDESINEIKNVREFDEARVFDMSSIIYPGNLSSPLFLGHESPLLYTFNDNIFRYNIDTSSYQPQVIDSDKLFDFYKNRELINSLTLDNGRIVLNPNSSSIVKKEDEKT